MRVCGMLEEFYFFLLLFYWNSRAYHDGCNHRGAYKRLTTEVDRDGNFLFTIILSTDGNVKKISCEVQKIFRKHLNAYLPFENTCIWCNTIILLNVFFFFFSYFVSQFFMHSEYQKLSLQMQVTGRNEVSQTCTRVRLISRAPFWI